MDFTISLEHQGQIIAADVYGANYLQQYGDIINKFKPRRPELSMLEWGSGLTSLFVDRNKDIFGIKYFLSVEHDQSYANSVRCALRSPTSNLVHVDLNGPCQNQFDTGLNYSTYPIANWPSFDLIFIDGRRRMECAMMALLAGPGDQTVIMHDYRRNRYQPILAFYDVLEDGDQFRVMRPKSIISEAVNSRLQEVKRLLTKAA